jgi:hypothetical protein
LNGVDVVLLEDAGVPPPWTLPTSEDRYVAQDLVNRRGYPVPAIIEALGKLGQPELLEESFAGDVEDETADAVAPIAGVSV